MKYFLIFFLSFFLFTNTFSQVEIRAGMGIDFFSNPSLVDYLNQNYVHSSDELGSFNSSIVFSAEGGYYINETYQIGLEIAYLLNSFSFSDILGKYDLSYGILMPTIMNYYVIRGEGYYFKFGGGVGLRFLNVEETLAGTAFTENFNSTGVGFILRADGNTKLGENVYANIGADLKYNLNGNPKNDTRSLTSPGSGEEVNFNSISAGVRLGVTFLF